MPFVTEEIWAYLPGGRGRAADRLGVSRGRRVAASTPRPSGRSRPRSSSRARSGAGATSRACRWRAFCPRAFLPGNSDPHELVGRLARLEVDGAGGDALASVGSLELLGSDEIDPAQVAERIEARAAELRSEVERGERKLSNEGFVAKAPPEVVEDERAKLEGYRAELAELTRVTAEDWLASLDPIGWRFGLDRIKALLAALGDPSSSSNRSTWSAPTASRR